MANDGRSSRNILEEVADYVGFGPDEAALLKAARPHLAPAFPAIVDIFYDAIEGNLGAAEVLEGPEQIQRLKVSMRRWLETLFSGAYDDAYLARRSRIGQVHVQIGLDQRYMFAAMSLLREGLKTSLGRTELTAPVAAATRTAIDKLCDIELAIMLESYRDAYTSGLRSERQSLVHDLRQSQTEKEELMRQAAHHEALATIGTLTAGLAHEVRNPLNAAKLQLELIGRAAAKLADQPRSIGIQSRVGLVNDELSRLSEMLDDFLALARQRHLSRAPFALLPLITEVVELEAPVAEAAHVVLAIGDIGDTAVDADRSKVKQVLVNLVSNAVDAMRTAGGGEVKIDCKREAAKVTIEVADTGPGIPLEVRDTLFEPFVTTKEAGTGLGLSIVQRIVRSHGGTVHVSTSDGGTCVCFSLPRADLGST